MFWLTVVAWHAFWFYLRLVAQKARGKLAQRRKCRWLTDCVTCCLPCLSTKSSRTDSPPGCGTEQPTCCFFSKDFVAYLWPHVMRAALVLFFEFYSTAAGTALGMLMCIKLPAQDRVAKRWVLDVLLQCPASKAGVGLPWGLAAVVLGAVLLAVLIF